MKENNLLDQIKEVRIFDDHRSYTSYRREDLIVDGNVIRLRHLLETEIESLYVDELHEQLNSLDVSAILNLEIIATDQEPGSSIISSFIDDVSIGRFNVNSCFEQDLLDLHRDVIVDEVESEIRNRFDESTLAVKIIRVEHS